ncbi:hypothetical protein BCR43DRAFT_267988 [Syncephalastrum racemosum]|uniref:Uncharacterized protein n=1 Tax=Syncephalastrum racemosum TaxID=13706 RepID=A0A1X2HBM0_SYNRA|nr:hypothetical protein BCR43DRAFT_267988 [Syncephalastrum racemosum]
MILTGLDRVGCSSSGIIELVLIFKFVYSRGFACSICGQIGKDYMSMRKGKEKKKR